MQEILANAVVVYNGQPCTTSTKIAEIFGKQHRDVLRIIRNIETPEDFNQRNFAPVDYTDAKGEKRPMYQITRDGFTLLAMGFTGKAAMRFKVAYILEFNRMEAEMKKPRRIRMNLEKEAETLRTAADSFHLAINRLQRTMAAYQHVAGWKIPSGWHEVEEFCRLEDLAYVNPKKFFNYYSSRRWQIDGKPITDWQSVCRRWDLNAEERSLIQNCERENFDEGDVK